MNTKLFGLFLVLLVCLPSFAQQKPVEKVDSDGVYLMPDQLPEFPGGIQAMMKFLSTNIKYPVEGDFRSCDCAVRHYGRRNIGSGQSYKRSRPLVGRRSVTCSEINA